MVQFMPAHKHSLLDSELLYLHELMPPETWDQLPSYHPVSSWLGGHFSLRRGQKELNYINTEFLEGRMQWDRYKQRLLRETSTQYQNLTGHHEREDLHIFPRMCKNHPKLARGFTILDINHHTIKAQIHDIRTLIAKLRQAEAADMALAEKLAKAMADSGQWLYRHLSDEEDLVVPIMGLGY